MCFIGVDSDKTYVAIKVSLIPVRGPYRQCRLSYNLKQGKVYDVTGNPSYAPGKAYHGT